MAQRQQVQGKKEKFVEWHNKTFFFFKHPNYQASCPTFGPKRSLSGQINLNICSCAAGWMQPEMCLVILLHFSRVRVCSSITALYETLFAATPFQLTPYFLLDNRVCNNPYCTCEQGMGNNLNAELLLPYILWKWFCKDHSIQSSFQIIKEERRVFSCRKTTTTRA